MLCIPQLSALLQALAPSWRVPPLSPAGGKGVWRWRCPNLEFSWFYGRLCIFFHRERTEVSVVGREVLPYCCFQPGDCRVDSWLVYRNHVYSWLVCRNHVVRGRKCLEKFLEISHRCLHAEDRSGLNVTLQVAPTPPLVSNLWGIVFF